MNITNISDVKNAGTSSGVPVHTSPEGVNNSNFKKSSYRIIKGNSYRDLSTVIVLPTPTEFIHNRVETAIDGIMRPMNQKVAGPLRLAGTAKVEDTLQVAGCEVGDAYNQALSIIKDNEDMRTWRFMLTVEHDNLPPPDGLIRLQNMMYENAEKDEDGKLVVSTDGVPKFHFLGIGGLYWTKGFDAAQPMIYGNPKEFPINYHPQVPLEGQLQECRGIAMGFTLWNLQALLKDKRLGPPWFETKASWDPGKGVRLGTQDLVFCTKASELGYRFAVDNNILVGHFDFKTGMVF